MIKTDSLKGAIVYYDGSHAHTHTHTRARARVRFTPLLNEFQVRKMMRE
jgi:hypothetical protein